MKVRYVFALLLFLLIVGMQTGSAASVNKVDQFMVIHPGGGQSSDADVYKTYKFALNHLFIADKGYNWNAKTHSYYYNGYQNWIDLQKVTGTKLRIMTPKMEGNKDITYVYTTHSASYYYWYTLRKELKKG